MRSIARITLIGATVALAGLSPPAAIAQSIEASAVSANVSLVTDYRFRGISQTNGEPAVQGGFDYETGPFYLGTWASNVSWLSDAGGGDVSSSLELDLYGGYRSQAGPLEVDLGGLFYYYPGSYPSEFNSPDTVELYGQVGWQGITLKYSHSLTDLFGFDDSSGSGYLDLGYETGISGFTVGAHLGRQMIPATTGRSSGDCAYTDWSVSAGTSLGGFDLSLAYIDTNADDGEGACYRNAFGKDLGKATLVLSVSRSF